MTQLPQNKVWSQVANRDVFDPTSFGSILASFGLNLTDNLGRMRLAVRMLLNTSETDVPELIGPPAGFWLCGSHIMTIAGAAEVGFVFENNKTMNGAFSKVTAGTAPSTVDSSLSGGAFSNNCFYVACKKAASSNIAIYKKIGDGNFALVIDVPLIISGYPSMLFAFGARTFLTCEQSRIISFDAADSMAYTGANTIVLNGIAFDFSNVITLPFLSGPTIWIPCINTTGERGHVYQWDGAATTYSAKHKLETAGAMAGCDYFGVPFIFDVEGNLQQWSGSAFKTVASLYRKRKKPLWNALSPNNNRAVHPQGMSVVDRKINIVIDTRSYDVGETFDETMPAGIYEYDPANPTLGLYCKNVFGLTKADEEIVDFGASRIAGAGAIKEFNLPSLSTDRNGSFLAGIDQYVDATVVRSGIFYDDSNDTLQKAGQATTLKFDATGIKNLAKSAMLMYSRFRDAGAKIILKFRPVEEEQVEATITWIATDQFTVLDSAVDISEYWNSENDNQGGEVNVIQGIGAGKCSHITGAVLAAGTWTVTVDQTYDGATGTAKAFFQKWKWLGETEYEDEDTSLKTQPESTANWIQFKWFMLWSGKEEVERFADTEDNSLPIED